MGNNNSNLDFSFESVKREFTYIKVLLEGKAGSGKTFGALKLAYGITGDYNKIAVLDTENKRAAHYDYLGTFKHADFQPPFDIDRFVRAIQKAEQSPEIEVLIIDSLSHYWMGEGGFLSSVDAQTNVRNQLARYKEPKKKEDKLINAILRSNLHIICTARVKNQIVENAEGKYENLGPKPIMRENVDHEFILILQIGPDNRSKVVKDTTQFFASAGNFLIEDIHGKRLKRWCENERGGTPDIDITNKDGLQAFKDRLTKAGNLIILDQIWSKYKYVLEQLDSLVFNELTMYYLNLRNKWLKPQEEKKK